MKVVQIEVFWMACSLQSRYFSRPLNAINVAGITAAATKLKHAQNKKNASSLLSKANEK